MEYNLKHYAHIGDAVWELFIREKIIQKTFTQKTMHEMTTKFVNAKFQAKIIEENLDCLTDEEKDIAKRGRNLPITINKRSNPQTHRLATAFEVLIGFWYLNNQERLQDFFKKIEKLIN